MIAVTGAAFVFSTLPSAIQGSSFAFASEDLTNTIRAGDELALVGPHFMRLYTRLLLVFALIIFSSFNSCGLDQFMLCRQRSSNRQGRENQTKYRCPPVLCLASPPFRRIQRSFPRRCPACVL